MPKGFIFFSWQPSGVEDNMMAWCHVDDEDSDDEVYDDGDDDGLIAAKWCGGGSFEAQPTKDKSIFHSDRKHLKSIGTS